ncbi:MULTISPECIES: hypothetical protein [unclassified Ensifer]|uniref:hypothetical protein n=1 Tax=unclassified Ensifer TaxID=2633371 RepID=UPI000B20572F|nr:MULTISPECIES: hypothetical protein [unclassified Ensifer]
MRLNKSGLRIAVTCFALAIGGVGAVNTAQSQALATSKPPLATGITDSGAAEAQVTDAIRDGDILTIKIRFAPIVPDKMESIYAQISDQDYENNFYVLAGDKKYLLLRDSQDTPLASPQLSIRNTKDSPVSGTWYGRFPAPPKDITEVSLTIRGVETIDAIPIADKQQ